jgi:carboxyl-terminal processing protease
LTHAIVVGEQTFGKGSVQSILPLGDGSALKLTTAKYYTPSHKVIHEHGITPDIIVPVSPEEEEDLRLKHTPGAVESLSEKDRERVESTHDRQMERAVDLLKGILLYAQRTAPAKATAVAR